MNMLGAAAVFAFALAFMTVVFLGTSEQPFVFTAPYHFEVGDGYSHVNALFFVSVFSLLLFGFSAPLAAAVEGAKYASLFATGALHAYDALFLVPEAAAMYSAILLGQGALKDFGGENNVFAQWNAAKNYFVFSLAAALVLTVAKRFV